jgi:nucleoside-diphosphate-sugar epimerase
MNVLVTGMGGVGVNVARIFSEKGYTVTCYDIVPREIDLLQEMDDKIKLVRGDILDFSQLLEVVRSNEIDGIIHTAIMYPIRHEVPDTVFRITIEGYKNILEVSRIEDLKVVFMSTNAVYGPQPDMTPIKEDDPVPRSYGEDKWMMPNLYITIKVAGEHLTQGYNKVYGLKTLIMRTSEIFGPGERTSYRSIPLFIDEIIKSGSLKLESGAEHSKDYTYAKDLSKAMVTAYEMENLPHRIFNLSGGQLYSLKEVADAVMEAIPGSQIEVGPGLVNPEGKDYEGMRAWINSIWSTGPLDITRAKQELNYSPTPFRQAIQEYATYMKTGKYQ